MLKENADKLKELLVPLVIIGVLGSVLLPIAPWALDLLIAMNLILAVALLATSLQIPDPLKLSALPTILLLCTLFRLCLNISTTRLILGSGQGGRIVEAFGSFVIGGNIGVGFVVFVILTFIQFIVVAKGSERVAEVAARFTLDAMPGKQMSIDADVRAGLYDMHTARLKRQELQTESRFYGALDGAMKFVKGDAIAGIFIVGVNCAGGLAAGLLQGLSFEQALHTYTILTIGDGLSSQIPSLLNSLAAGLVVTRVGGAMGSSLSVELSQQLSQSKMVMILAGGFSCLLGVVPGMPPMPLLTIGGLLCGAGMFGRREDTLHPQITTTEFKPRSESIVTVEVGSSLSTGSDALRSLTELIRQQLFMQTGVLINRFELAASEDLEAKIRIRGVNSLSFSYGTKEEFIGEVVSFLACRRLEFIDDTHTRRLLDAFEPIVPELVSSIVPQTLSLTQLTEVLKGLARERVSLRHFDLVLQAISETSAKAANERALLEDVRCGLGRIICGELLQQRTSLRCLMLAAHLDLQCAEAERERTPLEQDVIDYIVEAAQSHKERIDCVVTSKGARRIVSDFLNAYEVNVSVLSHKELCRDIPIEMIEDECQKLAA